MRSALKWLLLLPAILFFVLFFKTPVFAAGENQASSSTNQYLTPVTNPDVPKNMHTYTQSVFIEILSSTFCLLAGNDPLSANHKCLGINPVTHKIGFAENSGGLVGAMGGLIAATYSMPTSSSQYINYMASNFGLTKKAFAANSCTGAANGVGFCSVEPLTKIWIGMRDIVYLLFTIIFIVIGLAIMLRVHIDPRTVMTVENQIPKIIAGILLVTFSLAIAGILIDLMYVFIYLIGNVLHSVDPTLTNSTYSQIATASNPFHAISPLKGDTDIINTVANAFANTLINSMFNNANSPFTIPIINWDVGKFLLWLFLWIIFLIALIIALFRIWITLVMAYIMILMDIVFAPFWFLAGLLPGGSLGFTAWLRDIIANLAVFPVTIAMISLAYVFSHIGNASGGGKLFNPPLVGGIGDVGTLGGLITFGFIFMTPQALGLVKAAIKAPKFNVGPVFAPTSAATGVIRSTAAGAMTYSTSTSEEMGKKGFRRVLSKTLG